MRSWLNAISAAEPPITITTEQRGKRGDADQSHHCRDAIRQRPALRRPPGSRIDQLPSAISDGGASMYPARCLFLSAGLEDAVAQPHRLGRDLDQLFLVDPLERRIQRRHPRGRQSNRFVVA